MNYLCYKPPSTQSGIRLFTTTMAPALVELVTWKAIVERNRVKNKLIDSMSVRINLKVQARTVSVTLTVC